jgi:hypothetical protein
MLLCVVSVVVQLPQGPLGARGDWVMTAFAALSCAARAVQPELRDAYLCDVYLRNAPLRNAHRHNAHRHNAHIGSCLTVQGRSGW